MFEWLKRKPCDIIYLADTHSTLLTEIKFKEDWGNDCFFNSLSRSSRGTSILLKRNCSITVVAIEKDTSRNLFILD